MPPASNLTRALCVASLGLAAQASQGQDREPQALRQGFDITVPYAPTIARVGREDLLRYELHLTNFSSRRLTLKSIEVVDDLSGRPIGRLDDRPLLAMLDAPGAPADAPDRRGVDPGRRLVVYFDIPLKGRAPTRLRHTLEFAANGPEGDSAASATGGIVAVDGRPVPALGPPLRGGPWVAVYHPTLERGHRRVVYAVAGRAVIPGRFAIDWMPAGPPPTKTSRAGDVAERSGDAIAVSDGVVVGTRDEFAEPAPGAARAPVSLSNATGNYVALRLRSGRYAFYEHLLPGIPVKVGDRVARGQVVGRVGSTGSASRPHLHFHLADANSPLDAEGVPYTLALTQQIGTYGSVQDAEASGPWRAQAPAELNAFPPPNAVVMFRR